VDQATHNKIVSFIWGIADDVLRDLFKRGKYPDVILPMCVIRRMDAVLEPTKKKVLETKQMLDDARITEQRAALCDAAGQALDVAGVALCGPPALFCGGGYLEHFGWRLCSIIGGGLGAFWVVLMEHNTQLRLPVCVGASGRDGIHH
jgi:hypothetical protein